MTHTDMDPGTLANVQFRQVGKPLTRTDAPGKVTGRTPYAGDYVMPNMLHMRVLRADIASARLARLDVSKARALAGVACVLTADDLADRTAATDIPGQTGQKRLDTDQPILVRDRVRYFGEPLALIAAETRDIADHAAELIEFELEPIPGVYDTLEALKPGAPLVYGSDNIVAERKIKKGDAEAGFARADLIVENTYRTPFQEHAFLEPEVGLAWVDENDVVNIRVSTQVIEHFRPHRRCPRRAAQQGPRARRAGGRRLRRQGGPDRRGLSRAARQADRPAGAAGVLARGFLRGPRQAPPLHLDLPHRGHEGRQDHGARREHDRRCRRLRVPEPLRHPLRAGGSARPLPGGQPQRLRPGGRDQQHVHERLPRLRRAAGCAAYEQQMDEIANTLGIDRLELRRRNFLKTGEPMSTGFVPPSAIWTEQCAEKAWAGLGEPTPAEGPIRTGRGLACYQQSYGRLTFLHDTSEAWVGVEMDGTVVVRSGVTDIGAGQISALGQIAVEVLGVTLDNVVIYNSDSAVTPLAGTTTATRALYMTGNAAKQAAEGLRARLAERAAQEFGVTPDEIDMAFNEVFVIDNPEKTMPLVDLVRTCAAEGIHRSELAIFRAPFGDFLDPETGQGQAHPDYAYGAHAVEVSVDVETGEVEVLKSVAAHDVGQCINPAAVEGQIQGGAQNGHGYALSEEMLYEEGRLVTPSFSEYLMPTAMDMPNVECIILESRSGVGPFGAKGIGEPAMTAVAPAIANAVADAIGVRVFEMPITPERVVTALQQRDAS